MQSAKSIKLRIALFAAFASGFSSLTLQIVWQKYLGYYLGIEHISCVVITLSYMAGLGVGALLSSRVLAKGRINAYFRLYIAVELAISGFALLFAFLAKNRIIPESVAISSSCQLTLASLLFAIPALLMGFAFAMYIFVGNHLVTSETKNANSLSLVYSSNIAGASAAVLITGLFLIGFLGLFLTSVIAVFVNVTACTLIVVLVISGNLLSPRVNPKHGDLGPNAICNIDVIGSPSLALSRPIQGVRTGISVAPALAIESKLTMCSFMLGFVMLAYEIILFRTLSIYIGPTTYSYPVALFSYLLALALGTRLSSKIHLNGSLLEGVQFENSLPHRGLRVVFGSIALMAVSANIMYLLPTFLTLIGIPQSLFIIRNFSSIYTFAQIIAAIVLSFIICMPVVAGAAAFPALVSVYKSIIETRLNLSPLNRLLTLPNSVSKLYGVQCLGNTLGSLVYGFFMFSVIGIFWSFQLINLLFILILLQIASIAHYSNGRRPLPSLRRLALVGFLSSLSMVPTFFCRLYSSQFIYDPISRSKGPVRASLIYEDSNASTFAFITNPGKVEVYTNRAFNNSFALTNSAINLSYSAAPFDLIYDSNIVNPKRILYIGMGSAFSAAYLSMLYPDAKITIVELNKRLLDIAEHFHVKTYESIKNNRNISIIIGDGVKFLNRTQPGHWDLIHVGLYSGWAAGNGYALSQEFLEASLKRLSDNGLFVMNAYPNSVQAAINMNVPLAIVAYGNQRISELVLSKNPRLLNALRKAASREPSRKALITVKSLEYIGNSIESHSLKSLRRETCVLSSIQFSRQKHSFTPATLDNLASEYYLTHQLGKDGFFDAYTSDQRILLCPSSVSSGGAT